MNRACAASFRTRFLGQTLKREPHVRGVLQDAVPRPSLGFSPGLPRRPDAADLALVILSVAVGAALVLVAAAVFIQMFN